MNNIDEEINADDKRQFCSGGSYNGEEVDMRNEISNILVSPRLWLANYFTDMRREVDMAYKAYSRSIQECKFIFL